MSDTSRGTVFTLFASIAFATEAVLVKFVYAEGVGPLPLLVARLLMAAVVVAPIFFHYIIKHRPGWRTHLAWAVVGGVLSSALFLLLMLALQRLSASITIIALFIYPAITTVLASFILAERITPRKALALIVSLVGVALVSYSSGAAVDLVGLTMAFGAALANAFIFVAIKLFFSNIPPTVTSAGILTWTAVTYSALGLASGVSLAMTPSALSFVAALAIIPTILSVTFLNQALAIIEASRVSIVMTTEPPITAILAAAFLGERLTALQTVGGTLILGSVLLLASAASASSSSSD